MRPVVGSRVAVVGGAGFLGSHLVEHLSQHGYVLVVDNLVVGRREWIGEAAFEHHDITGSEEHLKQVFERHDIDFVFNYAAYPYVPDSYDRPLHVFNVNAFGALKVINAADKAGCEGILQVSSAELYGGGNHVSPHSSYGASKAAIDFLVQCAWKERSTKVLAVRQFNCVGERESHPYVVPEIISQLTKGPIVRLGNNSRRDFMYAGDAVRLATEILENGEWGSVYDLGSEESICIHHLAELIGRILGYESITVELDESKVRKWEIWNLCARNELPFGCIKPETSLEEALRRTIAWYKSEGSVWPWETKPTSSSSTSSARNSASPTS